ncbi:MAG TPA: hypothetical protein VL282_10000 [Tepidisphaeraceae bacterium]|jgi:hypothetical protein|nr:hypothetical protein [Tepidisphaeraceae bacterium]
MSVLKLHPNRAVWIMGTIWCCMIVAYGATQYYKRHGALDKIHHLEASGQLLDDDTRGAIMNPRGVVKLFDFDAETNLPALFQTLSLGFVAVLLFGIASNRKAAGDPLAIYWKVLAWMFVFLMLDEGCSIHNNFHVYSVHTRAERDRQGIFYFSWTLAYGALMLPIGLWYLRFLFKLPRTYGVQIFIAGVIYVIGAMGLEMAFGDYLAHGGIKGSRAEIIFNLFEESLETLGTLLFIHVLLRYMVEKQMSMRLHPVADAPRQAVTAAAAPASLGIGPLHPAVAKDRIHAV